MLIAAIWRSYLRARSPQLWPSPELRDIIFSITMYVLVFTSHITCIVIFTVSVNLYRMLHSAKQFIDGGIQLRNSKLPLVRRIKVAWDTPKMKAYRKQLAKGALMAQARIQISINSRDITFAIYRSRF